MEGGFESNLAGRTAADMVAARAFLKRAAGAWFLLMSGVEFVTVVVEIDAHHYESIQERIGSEEQP